MHQKDCKIFIRIEYESAFGIIKTSSLFYFQVIFGGGRQTLMTNAPFTVYDKIDEFTCSRSDNRDLIESWLNDKAIRNVKSQYIQSNNELVLLDTSRTEYALGE